MKTIPRKKTGHDLINRLCRTWLNFSCLRPSTINTLKPRQNGRHFPEDIFKCIFLNENEIISIKISLKFVSKGQINNISSLIQIMAWRRPGNKPLSEAMMVSLLMHLWVARPQWVKVMKSVGNKAHTYIQSHWMIQANWGRNKMTTSFGMAYVCELICLFSINLKRNVVLIIPRISILIHLSRSWLCTQLTTGNYLKQ